MKYWKAQRRVGTEALRGFACAVGVVMVAVGLGVGGLARNEVWAQTAPVAATLPAAPAANAVGAQGTGTPFRVKWHFVSQAEAGSVRNPPGLTDAIVSKEVVYFGDDAGAVRAVKAKDGTPLWVFDLESRIAGVVTDDERVYCASEHGLTAFECAKGLTAWDFPISHGCGGCAAGAEAVFCGGNDGLVYAVDRRTGEKLWSHSMVEDAPADPPDFPGGQARFSGSPARPTGIATDGKYVYQSIFDQSRVIALDCKTGKQQWSFQAKGWILGSAASNDKHVFFGSQDGSIYCVKKEDGTRVWDFKTRNRIEATPMVAGNRVYVASCDGNLYCLESASGRFDWMIATERGPKLGTPIYSKPVVVEDMVCFATGEGQVYAVDAASGQLRWKVRPAGAGSELFSSPASDGARIFVTSRGRAGRGADGAEAAAEGEWSVVGLEK